MPNYTIILSQETLSRLESYRIALDSGEIKAGERFQKILNGVSLTTIAKEDFLELLLNTKIPQVFAESAVHGDGRDWTLNELRLLGDVSIGMSVQIFDDGRHQKPLIHETPFSGFLIYIPGALLRNDQGESPADWREIHTNAKFDQSSFTKLYRRRLGPVLKWVETTAINRGRPALVTIPGLGCGQFAGPYIGTMGEKLEIAFIEILKQMADELPSIKGIWYDPYGECEVTSREYDNLKLLTRPLLKDPLPRPQLSDPLLFGFASCDLYSLVAWDHVSWPGNDYYVGSRVTDDGVKAAATDTMRVITGQLGVYDPVQTKYLPPEKYSNWRDVVYDKGVSLKAVNRIFID